MFTVFVTRKVLTKTQGCVNAFLKMYRTELLSWSILHRVTTGGEGDPLCQEYHTLNTASHRNTLNTASHIITLNRTSHRNTLNTVIHRNTLNIANHYSTIRVITMFAKEGLELMENKFCVKPTQSCTDSDDLWANSLSPARITLPGRPLYSIATLVERRWCCKASYVVLSRKVLWPNG